MPGAIRRAFPDSPPEAPRPRREERVLGGEEERPAGDLGRLQGSAFGRIGSRSQGSVEPVRGKAGREAHPPFRRYLSEPGPFSFYRLPKPIGKALHASNAVEAFQACTKRKLGPRPGIHSIRNGHCLISVEAERHDRSRHRKAIAGFDELSDEELKQVGMSRRKELTDAARRKAPRLGDTHNSSVVSDFLT